MSWIYFYDDMPEDRKFFGDWLARKLGIRVVPYGRLDSFDLWLETHGKALPALIIMDLYTGNDIWPTLSFLERLRAEPQTRQIPAVILTNAPEEEKGAEAFATGKVNDYFCKGELMVVVDGRRFISDSTGRLLCARLESILRFSRDLQRRTSLHSTLSSFVKKRAFAIFESDEPHELGYASPDVLRLLNLAFQYELGGALPEVLRKGFAPGAAPLTFKPNDGRTVEVKFDRSNAGTIVATFRDVSSPDYMRALTAKVLDEKFHSNKEKRIKEAMEKSRAGRMLPTDDNVKALIDRYAGYLYALANIPLPGAAMSAAMLVDAAGQWQRSNLTGECANPPGSWGLSMVHASLLVDEFSKAGEMQAEICKLAKNRPLVESMI